MTMNAADTKRLDKLVQKVATLDSTNDLTPTDRRVYDRLTTDWEATQPVAAESYGF